MIPYCILLIITCFLCALDQKKSSKTIRKLIFVILGVFSGIRYYVSVDYKNYCDVFYAIRDGGYYSIEKSYYLLSKMIQGLDGTPQIIFLLYSLSFSFFIYKYIESESADFSFSILIYLCLAPFYLSSFNTMRQALAVSIILYALMIDESKKAKIIILIAGAVAIHSSAIVGVLIFALKKMKLKKGIMLVFGLSILLYIFLSVFGFNYLSQNLSEFRQNSYSTSSLGISYIIFLFCGLLVLFLSFKNRIQITKIEESLAVYSCVLILVAFVSGKYETVFARLITFGSFFFVISYPALQSLFSDSIIFRYFSYLLFIGYYFVTLNGAKAMIPYKFSLQFFNSNPKNIFFIFVSIVCLMLFITRSPKKEIESQPQPEV